MLANATGAIVNVDHLKVHGNTDGSVDQTKTDVFLHFVHPDNNTVMEVADILRTIDYKTIELDPFFKEFNVLETDGSASYLPLKVETSETVIISWLAGVCVFICLLLLVIVSICVSQRTKYARKLKAVTTKAYLGPTIGPKKEEFVPNTNRHASEGSNPVWMTGVEIGDWGVQSHQEGAQPHSTDLFTDNLDSLDSNVLNDTSEDAVERVPEGLENVTEFYMSREVLYTEDGTTRAGPTRTGSRSTRAGSTDRQSDSSGRGSLFTSSQFLQSRTGSLHCSKPLSGERLNNPRAYSRYVDLD